MLQNSNDTEKYSYKTGISFPLAFKSLSSSRDNLGFFKK